MNSQSQLRIEQIWEDDQMVELRVCAASERFSGEVEVYATYEELKGIARVLVGFPTSHPQRFEFHFSASRGSNRVKLTFETADSRGHCWALISLSEKERSDEHARIALAVEPAALDSFAHELQNVANRRLTTATLLAGSAIGLFPPSLSNSQ